MYMSTKIIILAAGRGTRMGGELPKVLVPLGGKPLVSHLLHRIRVSGICERPTIVVGHAAGLVKGTLGPQYEYIEQKERLGTGHAVASCKAALAGKSERVMVFCGDMPFIAPEVIRTIEKTHREKGTVITMATIQVPDFDDWRSPFYFFGRAIRDDAGEVIGSVEFSDATEEQKKSTDLNPGFFCFDADWLWRSVGKIQNKNAKKEYYIGDLIPVALDEGRKIASLPVPPETAVGVNTPEQLALAERAFLA